MSLWKRRAKRDQNEQAIAEALRAAGASVEFLSGKGAPDLLVAKGGSRMWLLEVKGPKGQMTYDQLRWRSAWVGPQPITVRTIDEALQVIR